MRWLLFAPALLSLVVSGAAAEPTFRCRAHGIRASQGETLCIPTHAGPQLARCGKVLNNSSWTFLERGCSAPTAAPEGGEAEPAPKPD
jgi:hypothetical protein